MHVDNIRRKAHEHVRQQQRQKENLEEMYDEQKEDKRKKKSEEQRKHNQAYQREYQGIYEQRKAQLKNMKDKSAQVDGENHQQIQLHKKKKREENFKENINKEQKKVHNKEQ